MKNQKYFILFLVVIVLIVFTSMASAKQVISVMRVGVLDAGPGYLEPFKEYYEKKHPDVEIKIVNSDWGSYHERIPVWVRAGKEPDVYLTSVMEYGMLQRLGAILPLDDVIDEELKSTMPKRFLDWFSVDGSLYGVPGQVGAYIFWYNKDIFKEAGLDPAKPPTNWQELKEYAVKIKENTDAYPIGLNLGRPADATQLILGNIYYSATNEPFVDGEGKARFNSPNGIAAIKYMLELVEEGLTQPNPEQTTKGDTRILFKDGKVAMYYDTCSSKKYWVELTDLTSAETSKFATASPIKSSFEDKKAMVTTNADPWVVSANSKYPEIAKDVLRELLKPEWTHAHNIATSSTPFRTDVMDQFDYDYEWMLEQNHEDLMESFSQTLQTPPGLEDIPIKTIYTEALQKVVLGMLSVEEALNGAAQEIEKVLKEADEFYK